MAKGKGAFKGAGGMRMPGNFGGSGMLAQIQKLQEEMIKTQEELAQETVEVTAGGGALTVVITGQQHVQSIRLDPDLLNPNDVEMVQDLIVAAMNEAIEKSRELAASRMSGLTGGFKIPGLM